MPERIPASGNPESWDPLPEAGWDLLSWLPPIKLLAPHLVPELIPASPPPRAPQMCGLWHSPPRGLEISAPGSGILLKAPETPQS